MKKFDNFCSALNNLKDIYNYEEPYENVILTGLVALYEICFEQSWKAMKEILEHDGVPESQTGFPRQILKLAYQMGLIKDEELWLAALKMRNNVAHSYNHAVALDIVDETKDKFYEMFCELKRNMEENWII